jgi:hypothetical protein
MKLLLVIFIPLLLSHAQAEIITSKFCENFYKTALNKKSYKLHAVYESKTLCAFEMNKNTISFKMESVAPGQNFNNQDKELLNYKGKWINIFSKDQTKDVIDQSLSDLGIDKKDSCISALPIKNSVQCPLKDKNVFKIIVNSKDENFIQKEFSL